ncbi:MAG: hypothetical protein IJW19_00495 [Clostridia bacterium]|nr:hypothetical protein [Clostridia bacterium]
MKIEYSVDDASKQIQKDICEGCMVYFYRHKHMLADKNYNCVYRIIRNSYIKNGLYYVSADNILQYINNEVLSLLEKYPVNKEEAYASVINILADIVEHHFLCGRYIDPLEFIDG